MVCLGVLAYTVISQVPALVQLFHLSVDSDEAVSRVVSGAGMDNIRHTGGPLPVSYVRTLAPMNGSHTCQKQAYFINLII